MRWDAERSEGSLMGRFAVGTPLHHSAALCVDECLCVGEVGGGGRVDVMSFLHSQLLPRGCMFYIFLCVCFCALCVLCVDTVLCCRVMWMEAPDLGGCCVLCVCVEIGIKEPMEGGVKDTRKTRREKLKLLIG